MPDFSTAVALGVGFAAAGSLSGDRGGKGRSDGGHLVSSDLGGELPGVAVAQSSGVRGVGGRKGSRVLSEVESTGSFHEGQVSNLLSFARAGVAKEASGSGWEERTAVKTTYCLFRCYQAEGSTEMRLKLAGPVTGKVSRIRSLYRV